MDSVWNVSSKWKKDFPQKNWSCFYGFPQTLWPNCTTLNFLLSFFSRKKTLNLLHTKFYCVKSARIRSYSGPYSVGIRENSDHNNSEYGHFSRSDSFISFKEQMTQFMNCLGGQIRTRIAPNTDTFHAVFETKIGNILIDWIQRTYSASKFFFLFRMYFITSTFTRRFSLKKIFP